MASTKAKGDLAEVEVAADLMRRGYRVSIPFGEDCDYDLVVDRGGILERVQVKYATPSGGCVQVRCRSHSLTNGKIRRTKSYTPATVDWLAVFDPVGDRCYYVPSSELGPHGRASITLRLESAGNNQEKGIRFAADYADLAHCAVEPAGFEPATFRMQTERSAN